MSLNLNQSTARTLVNNAKISSKLAKAIVSYRRKKQDCPITDLQELWKVPGMTEDDFVAISNTHRIPESYVPCNIKDVIVKDENTLFKSTRNTHGKDVNVQKEKSPNLSTRSTSPASSGKKKKRNRKKKKNRGGTLRNVSPSPNRRSSRKSERGSTTLGKPKEGNLRVRSRACSPGRASTVDSRRNSGTLALPNLFLNSDIDHSPYNTLLRLAGGKEAEAQKVLTPVSVEKLPDGMGLIVRYKEASLDAPISYNAGLTLQQPDVFSRESRAASTLPRKNTDYSERGKRHQSDHSSRSRKSTPPPPEKRSRSSPAKTDYSKLSGNIREDCDSNLPFGLGSSTTRTGLSVKGQDAESSKVAYRDVQNWLDTVQEKPLKNDTVDYRTQDTIRSPAAQSKVPDIRKKLDIDNEAGPSGNVNKNLNYREGKTTWASFEDADQTLDHGNINELREQRHHQSKDTKCKLTDMWEKTRNPTEEQKNHHKSDHRSRHKSRHRWNNKVVPSKPPDPDERRPVEARLDRRRDRSMDVSEEMRRLRKRHSERRHRHRSRARSGDSDRRRGLFNCSIM